MHCQWMFLTSKSSGMFWDTSFLCSSVALYLLMGKSQSFFCVHCLFGSVSSHISVCLSQHVYYTRIGSYWRVLHRDSIDPNACGLRGFYIDRTCFLESYTTTWQITFHQRPSELHQLLSAATPGFHRLGAAAFALGAAAAIFLVVLLASWPNLKESIASNLHWFDSSSFELEPAESKPSEDLCSLLALGRTAIGLRLGVPLPHYATANVLAQAGKLWQPTSLCPIWFIQNFALDWYWQGRNGTVKQY